MIERRLKLPEPCELNCELVPDVAELLFDGGENFLSARLRSCGSCRSCGTGFTSATTLPDRTTLALRAVLAHSSAWASARRHAVILCERWLVRIRPTSTFPRTALVDDAEICI